MLATRATLMQYCNPLWQLPYVYQTNTKKVRMSILSQLRRPNNSQSSDFRDSRIVFEGLELSWSSNWKLCLQLLPISDKSCSKNCVSCELNTLLEFAGTGPLVPDLATNHPFLLCLLKHYSKGTQQDAAELLMGILDR